MTKRKILNRNRPRNATDNRIDKGIETSIITILHTFEKGEVKTFLRYRTYF